MTRNSRPLAIFDLDGTLFKSETSYLPAIRETLRAFGLPDRGREEILLLLTGTSHEAIATLLGEHPGVDAGEFRAALYEREQAYVRDRGELYDGARALLGGLVEDGVVLALCSNAPTEYIDLVLSAFGLGEFFAAVRGNDRDRPKAELVCTVLAAFEPGAACMVGDSRGDHLAAVENEIPFVGAGYGYGRSTLPGDLEYRAGSLREAVEMVEGLLSRAAGQKGRGRGRCGPSESSV